MLSLRLPWKRRDDGAHLLGRHAASTVSAPVDFTVIWSVAILMLFGLVMVYSATIALPDSPRFSGYRPHHFLIRQAAAILIGVVVGCLAFAVPTSELQKRAPTLFVLGIVLLALVLIPGVGKVVYGARRWLPLGPLNLQPSEFMKLFVALYAADYAVRKQSRLQLFMRGFGPIGSAVILVGFLVMFEPDLGAFFVICVIAMGVLFLGGISGRHFVALVLLAITVVIALIALFPWRMERIFAYLDPFADPMGSGYQLTHSLIAFGRGEWLGVGLGGSVEKLHYLPEAHTDFLLAVIGEELGFVGVMVVIALFYWLTKRGFEIGRQAIAMGQVFQGLAAKGIALWIGMQAFINMGVNLGLLPTKGLTLPLMSYGGSGLLVNCIAIAILLRIDFESRRLMRGDA